MECNLAIIIKIKNTFILWPNNSISQKFSTDTIAHVQKETCTRLLISVQKTKTSQNED